MDKSPKKEPSYNRKTEKKGGKILSALCSVAGTLILLAVILSCVPLTVPRFFGYEVYSVVSGSMAPKIPVGSIIYVQPCEAADVAPDEIILFQSGDSMVVHRVVKNNVVEGKITTKGDANASEDLYPVSYQEFMGRVKYHIPLLGNMLLIYGSTTGKIYVFMVALCGVLLNIVAGRLRRG